uniref:Uncharacterized protein n=1 Tax=Micrurus lemniscatus lemniscatus TaxID=129467 RepID=A0A2D4IUR7_MICLE
MISRTGKSYSYSHTMHQFKQKLHCHQQFLLTSPHSCMIGIETRSRAKSSLAFLCECFELLCSPERTGRKEMKEGLQDLYLLRATNLSAAYRHTHPRTHTPAKRKRTL